MVESDRSVSSSVGFVTAVDLEAKIARLHSVNDLVALVPGSTRGNWLRSWIPQLIESGVLVKKGKRFLGRPVDIVNALLASAPVTTGRHPSK